MAQDAESYPNRVHRSVFPANKTAFDHAHGGVPQAGTVADIEFGPTGKVVVVPPPLPTGQTN